MQSHVLVTTLFLVTSMLPAQVPSLVLPQASPRAQVSQTVGLTEMTVTYSRPSAHGRKIWGGLVPYNQVWRAGANENTVVTFSTPVQVGGKSLPAGSYGLHMLPTEKDWSVMFSSQSHAWGSYSYDAKEDAARVTVTPGAGPATDRLAYTFDDPSDSGVTLVLHWDQLKVPIRLEVDTQQTVLASLRDQLRGMPRFFPEPWAQAALWCAQHDLNREQALGWVEQSLRMRETFGALRVKAMLVEKGGDLQGAETLRARAMAIATETDVNNLAYTLLGQGKVDPAIELFRKNVADHPQSWNAYDSLGEAYATKGDRANATLCYQQALAHQPPEEQSIRIRETLSRLK